MATIRLYRYKVLWGGKLKTAKAYLSLEQIKASGGVPLMDQFRDVTISDDPYANTTSSFLRDTPLK